MCLLSIYCLSTQNHLDVQTVDALGDALEDFDGGLVLVSHDRRLLNDTCTEFYSVTKSGRLKALDGGVAQYVKSVTKGNSNAKLVDALGT